MLVSRLAFGVVPRSYHVRGCTRLKSRSELYPTQIMFGAVPESNHVRGCTQLKSRSGLYPTQMKLEARLDVEGLDVEILKGLSPRFKKRGLTFEQRQWIIYVLGGLVMLVDEKHQAGGGIYAF
ncbi:hypothetical protein SESBI_47589 [Sesbania bispinosa]|nr:hypothetical protein SESBI_47589 [Sesbania bispinosa]